MPSSNVFFAGLPLLIGVVINLMKRDEVKDTWLESHFDWQIRTVWVTLAGFALAGGLTFSTGIGLYVIFPTLGFLVYRIAVGWTALTAKRISNKLIQYKSDKPLIVKHKPK